MYIMFKHYESPTRWINCVCIAIVLKVIRLLCSGGFCYSLSKLVFYLVLVAYCCKLGYPAPRSGCGLLSPWHRHGWHLYPLNIKLCGSCIGSYFWKQKTINVRFFETTVPAGDVLATFDTQLAKHRFELLHSVFSGRGVLTLTSSSTF